MRQLGSGGEHLRQIDHVFYRMMFAHQSDDILAPAQSPEGRFHHSGQRALYLSDSRHGTEIAIKRYARPGDAERAIFALHVKSDRIVDLRDRDACQHYGLTVDGRAIDWLAYRHKGLPSPTWDISDRVRRIGLHGFIYPSRTDPQNTTHLVLFDWNSESGALVQPAQ